MSETPLALVTQPQEGQSDRLEPYGEYRKVFMSPERLEFLEKMLRAELGHWVAYYKDHVHPTLKKNQAIYEATTGKNITTIPIAKRDTNQQHAWHVETILSKDPLVTCDPLEPGTLPAIVQGEDGPVQIALTTEEFADGFERLLQHKLTQKIPFDELVDETIMCTLQGLAPDWWKIYYDQSKAPVRERKIYRDSDGKKKLAIVETTRKMGEPVHIRRVSAFRMYRPITNEDEQECKWLAEELTGEDNDPLTILRKIRDGVYDFGRDEAPDEQWLEGLASGHWTDWSNPEDEWDEEHPTRPQLFDVLLDYPLVMEGAAIIAPLCVTFDLTKGRALAVYENFYHHRDRYYVPFYMQKRPDDWSFLSTTQNLEPFERLISAIFNQQIQNLAVANVKVFLVREGTSSYKWFANGGKVAPGVMIPFTDKDDINPQQLGTTTQSMSGEINYLTVEAEKMSMVSDFDRGRPPGRTPVGVANQVQELAKIQPATVLRRYRRQFAKALKMYVQTLQQFADYGVEIPFRDPKQKAISEMALNKAPEVQQQDSEKIPFPAQQITDQFAFMITATGTDDSKEAVFEKNTVLYDRTMEYHMAMAEYERSLFGPEMMQVPEMMPIVLKKHEAVTRAFQLLFENERRDLGELVVPTEMLRQAAEALQQRMMQQQQMAAQGGANVVPGNAAPGGVVPGAPADSGAVQPVVG